MPRTDSEDPDSKVLSYGDVLLRKSDVDLLRGPFWLNDQIIAFYYEYLLNEAHKLIQKVTLLLGGATTFFLAHAGSEDVQAMARSWQLPSRSLIIAAINDNPYVDEAGGSHWSLLAYTRQDHTFRHYNSSKGLNRDAARKGADVLGRLLVQEGKTPAYVEAKTPQQSNGNDCGIYLLAITEMLCNERATGALDILDMEQVLTELLTPAHISRLRSRILKLITDRIRAGNPV
ncbi:hypothetical protein WJX72_003778 [[Myrmecia] bisecta]|uniref:Ubiquitin-like protease family profile domain-containing protein n=1 Tax=[Myrmecia] bisecta TaxID=41462 RepID=A0AAW1PNN2_9CHLO